MPYFSILEPLLSYYRGRGRVDLIILQLLPTPQGSSLLQSLSKVRKGRKAFAEEECVKGLLPFCSIYQLSVQNFVSLLRRTKENSRGVKNLTENVPSHSKPNNVLGKPMDNDLIGISVSIDKRQFDQFRSRPRDIPDM